MFFMGIASVLAASGSNWWIGGAVFFGLCAVDMIVATIATDSDLT